jgi:phosphoribosyl-dephospho-CoA transferase
VVPSGTQTWRDASITLQSKISVKDIAYNPRKNLTIGRDAKHASRVRKGHQEPMVDHIE